jgi:hypothetical protein
MGIFNPYSARCRRKRKLFDPAGVDRRPDLLHDLATVVLEHALEAAADLLGISEVVGEDRHPLVAQHLCRILPERMAGLRRTRRCPHEPRIDVALREILGGRRRGNDGQLGFADLVVDGERFERRQRTEHDMHLVALNQLLQLGLGDSRRGRGIDRVKLDLAAGEQVVLFLQELKKTRFHLQADSRKRTGLSGHEADADRCLRIRANETETSDKTREEGDRQGGDDQSAHDILPICFLPSGWVSRRADVNVFQVERSASLPRMRITCCGLKLCRRGRKARSEHDPSCPSVMVSAAVEWPRVADPRRFHARPSVFAIQSPESGRNL